MGLTMNSLSFPDMFTTTSTLVVRDRDASAQDLKLLLASETGELFGDPFFGVRTKKYTFNQNNYVLRDVLVDEIFTKLRVFAPQVTVNRDDIVITQEGNRLYAIIRGINKLDFITDMYQLELFQGSEE